MTVLIAGGGVAGAAAACLLGPAATVFERETAPGDKICGEFVSWEAQDALGRLGLDLRALGGEPIRAVRLVHGGTLAETRLPRPGVGLSRRRLDAALLERAVANGAVVVRGRAVRRVAESGLEVEGLGLVGGERVLLATGKHEVRGVRRGGSPDALVGLKMYYRLDAGQAAALAGHVEVVLFPGGYAGLQPVEGGRANLCLLIRRAAFERAGSNWAGVVAHLVATAPHLAQRLLGAVSLLERPVTIFRVPYGYVHEVEARPCGVLRLGDQMGVIPSFSGDGIAIALHTAFAAAEAVSAASYHRRMRADLCGQIGRAMALHRAGQAWPGLVATAARAWPGALAWVARLTRVPEGRLAWR